jgi:hypothetical protein
LLEIQEEELKRCSSTESSEGQVQEGKGKEGQEEILRNLSVTRQQLKKVELAKRKYKVSSRSSLPLDIDG